MQGNEKAIEQEVQKRLRANAGGRVLTLINDMQEIALDKSNTARDRIDAARIVLDTMSDETLSTLALEAKAAER